MSRMTRQQAQALLADGVQADVRDSAEVLDLLERQFEAALRHRSSELTRLAELLAPLLDAMEARRQQRVALVRALPDFDAARVAELRDALAKGELPFDAGRLAGLIQRFHGKG